MNLHNRSLAWLVLLLLACPALHAATVLVNSQNYEDIIAASVYAAANGDTLAFAITPAQAVFITHYYTSVKTDQVIYLEGSRSVLPNMGTLLRETGLQNLTSVSGQSIQEWVADQFPKKQAILVGGGYGQDALALAPYAALTKSPVFFIDEPSQAGPLLDRIARRGYASVLIYGQLASRLTPEQTASMPEVRTIDTGSRYTNNMEIVRQFTAIKPARQVMFVSGYSFEKSMVDADYPIILVGRSSVPNDLASFLKGQNITSGVVFSGDSIDPNQQSSIVDGMASLRALYPGLAIFIKFGEGYAGMSQALPLMVTSLPSPSVSLQVLNLSYNVEARRFELRASNTGDFIYLSSGVFVNRVGSASSSQISLAPNQTTTIGIPLDATTAISTGNIPAADVTVNYGEDSGLLDNVDTVSFVNIPLSTYIDNSSLNLVRVTYSSEAKAFQLQMEGEGWVSGTLRFVIAGRPVVLDLPLQQIHNAGLVQVKYLLTTDEESYVNGLAADYFLRTGARSDILLREQRGQSPVTVSRPALLAPDTGSKSGQADIPWLLIFGVLVLVVGGVLGARYFMSRRDGFE